MQLEALEFNMLREDTLEGLAGAAAEDNSMAGLHMHDSSLPASRNRGQCCLQRNRRRPQRQPRTKAMRLPTAASLNFKQAGGLHLSYASSDSES